VVGEGGGGGCSTGGGGGSGVARGGDGGRDARGGGGGGGDAGRRVRKSIMSGMPGGFSFGSSSLSAHACSGGAHKQVPL
jgi:hypothetical protein